MPKERRKKSATALSPEHRDPSWQTLDERIGGRQGLLEVALVSDNPKAATLAELILDPAFKNAGTKSLAKRAGLSAPEIVDLYRNKQWLEATMVLHSKLPDIVGGAATDASPSMRPCEECKASGKSESGDDCWVCGGWGEVRKPGDKDKLSFIGEASGMIKRGGPAVQVNTQINNTSVSASTSFEELMRKATTVQPRKQIQEAEVIDARANSGNE